MSILVDIRKKLGDFSLNVRFEAENEALALLGASGCGKSVTLRCIAGIMTPDEGRIVLDGETLFDSDRGMDLPPQRRRVGYLFQQYALFPNMSVQRNIECVIKDKREKASKTRELLRRLQLEDVSRLRPAELSGGQQQRASLARILATSPRALLLDEPFSALDSFLKAQLEQELRNTLDDFAGTVLWVSHDRDEVFRNCRNICVIDAGASQSPMTAQQLFENPKTVAAAKLSGCKNILRAEARDTGVFLPEWGVQLCCKRAQGPGFVGLRAHHFYFCEPREQNALACEIVRAMDNVLSKIYILRPVGAAENAPMLRMETQKGDERRGMVSVAIAPENVMILREEK